MKIAYDEASMIEGARLALETATTKVCGLIAQHAKDPSIAETVNGIKKILEALSPEAIITQSKV